MQRPPGLLRENRVYFCAEASWAPKERRVYLSAQRPPGLLKEERNLCAEASWAPKGRVTPAQRPPCLPFSRFTVGKASQPPFLPVSLLERPPSLLMPPFLPVSLLGLPLHASLSTRFTVGHTFHEPPFHPFHCWACLPEPPFHPFHCWARYMPPYVPGGIPHPGICLPVYLGRQPPCTCLPVYLTYEHLSHRPVQHVSTFNTEVEEKRPPWAERGFPPPENKPLPTRKQT